MKAIGVDLGGTKLNIGIVDSDGNFEIQERALTLTRWLDMKDVIVQTSRDLIKNNPDVKAIGVGAAGMISHDGRVIYSPNVPAFNIDGGVFIKKELEQALGIPVNVDNDNNCSGYAEYKFGSVKGENNILAMGLGTGIGGALILDGHLYRGNDGYAFDIGHLTMDLNGHVCACGLIGCFETLGSGTALGRIAREHILRGESEFLLEFTNGDIDSINGSHVNMAIDNDPTQCGEILDEFSHNIALGLSSLDTILNFGICVISGGVSDLGSNLLERVNHAFSMVAQGSTRRILPEIRLAHFKSNAGVVGAGSLALDMMI